VKLLARLLTIWLTLVPSLALSAAGTVTQLGTAASTTTAVLTTGATINAGDLVVVVATVATTGVAVTSVVDSALECTTYTAMANAPITSRPTSAVFYCANAAGMAGGGTITATVASTDKIAITAFSLSGMSSTPADVSANQVNGASGTSATSTATGTRAQKYELIVGTLALAGNSSAFTPTTGFTNIGGTASGATGSVYAAYLVTCATATQAWAPTWTTSSAWMSNVVSFKVGADSAICASKTNTYDVLTAGAAGQISASKLNTYIVLQAAPTNHNLLLTHAIP
jgi:hypothetical protein